MINKFNNINDIMDFVEANIAKPKGVALTDNEADYLEAQWDEDRRAGREGEERQWSEKQKGLQNDIIRGC